MTSTRESIGLRFETLEPGCPHNTRHPSIPDPRPTHKKPHLDTAAAGTSGELRKDPLAGNELAGKVEEILRIDAPLGDLVDVVGAAYGVDNISVCLDVGDHDRGGRSVRELLPDSQELVPVWPIARRGSSEKRINASYESGWMGCPIQQHKHTLSLSHTYTQP